MAETMELAIKASRRPSWKASTTGNQAKGQTIKIRAETNGEEVEEQKEEEVVDRCPCEVEDQEEDDRVPDVEEIPQILTLWRATGVGCMAIWPVTAPKPVHSRLLVVALAPPRMVHSNPANQG